MDRIVLITVNYQTATQTIEFCQMVRSLRQSQLVDICIADNSGCFGLAENAELVNMAAQLDAKIIDTGGNLGYFGGASFGLDAYLAHASFPDCVIVANSDLEIVSDDFFAVLARFGSLGRDVFGIVPDIARAPQGATITAQTFRENPMKVQRISAASMRARMLCKRVRVLSMVQDLVAGLRRRVELKPAAVIPAGSPVYMMHGSFMILLRSYFERTAGLSFPSFLFGEEIFVAEETRKAGGQLIFEPALRLNHYGGASTSGIGSRARDRMEANSLGALIRRYF